MRHTLPRTSVVRQMSWTPCAFPPSGRRLRRLFPQTAAPHAAPAADGRVARLDDRSTAGSMSPRRGRSTSAVAPRALDCGTTDEQDGMERSESRPRRRTRCKCSDHLPDQMATARFPLPPSHPLRSGITMEAGQSLPAFRGMQRPRAPTTGAQGQLFRLFVHSGVIRTICATWGPSRYPPTCWQRGANTAVSRRTERPCMEK